MSISIYRGMQLGTLFLFGLVNGQADAAGGPMYGIGAGAISNGAEIYFPIRMTSLIVEPRISYYHYKDKTNRAGSGTIDYPPSSSNSDSTAPTTLQQVNTDETIEIGLGLFTKTQISNEIELYYGGRLGYLTDKRQQKQTNSYPDNGEYIRTSIYESDRKQTGYFLAPTIGLQYFPHPDFSLGIEVGFRYSNLSGHETFIENQITNDPTSTSTFRSESGDAGTVTYRTVTSAIVRGYF